MKKATLALAGLSALLALPFLPLKASADASRADIIGRNYDIFTSVVNYVDANYVDSLPLQEMFESAIDGFLAPLDPYTTFMNEKDTRDFIRSTKGEYGGIGSYLMKKGDYVVINSPYEGSPAMQAGLRTGDILLRIDTLDGRGISTETAREHLLGVPGSELSLRVRRPYPVEGSDTLFDVTLTRARLVNPTVAYYGVDNDGIGYLQLNTFGQNSADEVRDALTRMLADKKLRGIVLDLTDNGGGSLEAAIDILDLFLPKGVTVLTTKGKEGSREYVTAEKALAPASMPVAVLINGNSASASEVTAGALQDLDRAVLVGSKSYGKGLVQRTLPTPMQTMVKITISKYYIPSGRLIQAYDYSRRNPDGSVAHLPDSLARAFTTRAGRTVYDGGGLSPDTVVKYPDTTPLIYSLMKDDVIFDYANRYAASHPSISSPEEFKVTDEIFSDFKSGVDTSSLKYDRELKHMLSEFRTMLDDDGYMDENVGAAFDSLEKSLHRDPARDLDSGRPLIEMLLAPEIIGRYYGVRGHVISSLQTNPLYKAAREILLDPARYNSMLAAPAKAAKIKK